jgi:hypothetical protein
LGTPELKGKPGTLPLLVMVAAWGNQKWFGAREGTVFYAEALASYPEDQRSTDAYMEKVVSSNRTDGFAPVKASLDNLGRVQFERTDFRKGSVYEAALVKSCDTLALVLFFTSADRNTTDRLIAATDLKLDLAHSGCMIKARKN